MVKPTPKEVLSTGECADVLRALGDKTRLRILELLLTHEQCVTDLVLELQKSQPHISHHLRILRHARLIEGIREGQRICYRVNPQFQRALTAPKAQALDFGCCQLAFPETILQNRLSRR